MLSPDRDSDKGMSGACRNGDTQRIVDFIASQKAFTLATCAEGVPWCASCYYAFDPEGMRLIFMSSIGARHIREMMGNSSVAGSILPDRSAIGRIKGVQFTGIGTRCDALPDGKELRDTYLRRHPFAKAMEGECFAVELHSVKMTDNTLGFGKKLLWEARTRIGTADCII